MNTEVNGNHNSHNNDQNHSANNNNNTNNNSSADTTPVETNPIASMGLDDETASYGTNEDMFKGMVMGFLLGLIMLLWLPDRSLPLRTKFGIIAGIGVSVGFGLLKALMNPYPSSER